MIRLVRLPVDLPDVDAVNESFDFIRAGISKFPLQRWGLVFDMRQARPAKSPEIENAFRENRKRIYLPFYRMAILLSTAAGVMQVKRMIQQAPDPKIEVFSDEQGAIDWAMPQGLSFTKDA